jgi:hypothetical protein
MWGVNPPKKVTEHWIATGPDPTNFQYADTPFAGTRDGSMVDFAVRKHPTDGYWYAVGFETWDNSPLMLAKAPGPSGPWVKLDYKPGKCKCGVFGDAGPPTWADASRPDPNLAFTPDGRAWIFFTGKSSLDKSSDVTWRAGMVEVDIATGKAVSDASLLFDPDTSKDLPFTVASDLNLVSVPGQPDRIFAYANSADYPLVLLDVPDSAALSSK